MTARAALRAGAGVVTLASFPEAAEALENQALEAMVFRLDPERVEASIDEVLGGCDVAIVGPGFGLDTKARQAVEHVALKWPGKKVLDADALTICADSMGRLRESVGEALLTPHPGEMGRLLGLSAAQVESDRFTALARAVEMSGQTVLLKGPYTLVGQGDGSPWVASMGHPCMATAGSGDVLAGISGALALQLPLQRAGALAACVHGCAAQIWAAEAGVDRGILAGELADGLPRAFASLADARALLSD